MCGSCEVNEGYGCVPDPCQAASCAGYDLCDCAPESPECEGACADGVCDPSDGGDCSCAGWGDCEEADCLVAEVCGNQEDDDLDGDVDCFDTDCVGDAYCCYGDQATRQQCAKADGVCYEDGTVSTACCADNIDNDNDGLIDNQDEGCAVAYTCQDPCADNYEGAGTSCDADPMAPPCCTYGGQDFESEGGVDCCSDERDNDGDNLIDDEEDFDCGSGSCAASLDFRTSFVCGPASLPYEKELVGRVDDSIASNSDGTCSAADYLPLYAEIQAAGLCGKADALYEGSSGTAGVDYFHYRYTVGTICPSGYVLADGTCVCVGDVDADGLCDSSDPCDNISDHDIGSPTSANEAGLIVDYTTSGCECGSFVRDLWVDGPVGQDVADLQDILVRDGYLVSNAFSLGTFDVTTKDALIAYQTYANLNSRDGFFDAATRAAISSPRVDPISNGSSYDPASNSCPYVERDLCLNLCGDPAGVDCVEDQDWLDAHPGITRDVNGNCSCGEGEQMCSDFRCIPDTECCQPNDFWYCRYTVPPACIPDEECCGGCCGKTGQDLVCCENPLAAGCGTPDCSGLTGAELTCCQTPSDPSCPSCPSGRTFCPALMSCVADSADCPVVGCHPAGTAPGRDPFAQVNSYCTVVAATTDGADADTYGDFYKPWRVGSSPYEYETFAALDAFFSRCANGVSSCLGALTGVLDEQKVRRDDGKDETVTYPVYGVVTRDPYGASCGGTPCDHGEECALSVGAGGVSASCVPAVCDPCDQTLPDCPGNSGGSQGHGKALGGGLGAGTCCYDAEECECDPLFEDCCENGEEGCPLHGVAIEAVPNVIDVASNGRCLVVWTSQGMASVEVTGFGIDPELADHFAGSDEVGPAASSIYKISGLGTDGETYEATDLCATNPIIREL